MRRVSYIRISAFVCVVLGLAGIAGEHRVSAQTVASGASKFEIGAVRNETRAEPQFLQKIDFPATRRYVESIIDRYKFYQRRGRM